MNECKECNLRTCEGCEHLEKRRRNKHKKLDNYVYMNLEKYGNTVLDPQVYKDLGAGRIVDDLLKNGFTNIEITITENSTILVMTHNATKFN